ncbi:hypothetical protein RhiirC2_784882 [Rhizophagus irregularis]|uniref:Transposase domain-containing protein n=1 Tax=Rhizophagus irregularis TaxID=588596 RepID=A0A2N1MXI7_9GLOM|nr:hypothetical protein RhiirC2_784882 [Rhizophagus irregularis]
MAKLFTIYAMVSLWSHLSVHDRKILHHFVRVCTAFVSQILELDAVKESHERLIEIVKLIEEHCGRDKITPNLHLSLHLSECTYDFKPLYAFWYFSFERMNGVLGALPNSHRKIESEIMRRMMADIHIDITESESFPGEMLDPASENVVMSNSILDLLVEYYLATYKTLEFQKPFREGHENSRIISVKMKQFGRCRIGSETFGSNMLARHVDLPDGELEHNLSFIQWYQPANSHYYFSIEDDEICNVELWGTEFYPEGRDCIIPVHNILSRFVPIKYKILDRKNAREYLAVNFVNRKFNIR